MAFLLRRRVGCTSEDDLSKDRIANLIDLTEVGAIVMCPFFQQRQLLSIGFRLSTTIVSDIQRERGEKRDSLREK